MRGYLGQVTDKYHYHGETVFIVKPAHKDCFIYGFVAPEAATPKIGDNVWVTKFDKLYSHIYPADHFVKNARENQ